MMEQLPDPKVYLPEEYSFVQTKFRMAFNMRWLLILLCCTYGMQLMAQRDRSIKSLRQEADQYYAEEQYNIAIQYYRELTDQNVADADVAYRLAECYRKTFHYTEAEAYYLKVHYVAAKQYPLALYYYALMLKYNANFDEAITSFDEFIRLRGQDVTFLEFVEQAIVEKAGCDIAKSELAADKGSTRMLQLTFNTTFNDYAPAVRDSLNIVVTSGRISSNRESIDERFGEAFTDNYYFEKVSGAWQDRTRQLFSITNTRFNDGSGCFNAKGDKYYFTVCGVDGPQCKIYLTVFKNDKWSEPVVLNNNVNYKSYEAKHPAVHGGDTLIFASNRPGGQGHFDLWMSINAGDDNWGPAVNLGRSINTKLNEISPTLTAYNNVVFFASDGHPGHGGLDMFMAKKLSTSDTVLYNLDLPFNSNRDDGFLSFAQHELYWSSNRPKGLGAFDIYSVKIPSVLAFISKISLKKRDSRRSVNLLSRTVAANQQINVSATRHEERIDYENLTYEKKQIVQKIVENRIKSQDDADQFGLTVSEYNQLKVIAERRYHDILDGKVSRRDYLVKVKPASASGADLLVNGYLEDSVSGKRIFTQKVLLTDRLGEVMKTTVTNDEGKFRFTNVSPDQELYIRVDNGIATQGTIPVVRELEILGGKMNQQSRLENIYFDFDHYNIRPEAERVLASLASYLIKDPNAQVEVFAYADNRGSNDYNLKLTQKRGQSVVDYLKKMGVDQTGLAIIAKGKAGSETKRTAELQRQFDRRIELYVNGEAFVPEPIKTFILKKKMSWEDLSQLTGVPQATLKQMNGNTDETELKMFQPVRIPDNAKRVTEEFFLMQ